MDDTSKELNWAVAMKHAFFQRAGNQNVAFRHIVEYPFFTRSELSNGVQLADLLAYNVYRAFRDENFVYPHFEKLLPAFYRRQGGVTLDGLKVWPQASPLVDWARGGVGRAKKRSPPGRGGRLMSGWANHIEPTRGTRHILIYTDSVPISTEIRVAASFRSLQISEITKEIQSGTDHERDYVALGRPAPTYCKSSASLHC